MFREQEDTAGYLIVSGRRSAGTDPARGDRDRHTLFETLRGSLMTLEERLADTLTPTRLGRAFEDLGHLDRGLSPQAKGRIERAWGTLQDRLVTELRLAGADDLPSANAVLARFLPRFDRRFSVPAADPALAWRPLPAGARIERDCCLKYRRVVANDHTVRAGATIIRLSPGPGRRGYAGRRVEVQLRLDGRIVVWDGEREVLAVRHPPIPCSSGRSRWPGAAVYRRPECGDQVGHHPGPGPSLAQNAGRRPARPPPN